MKKKIISVLLFATVTAGAFAYLNKAGSQTSFSGSSNEETSATTGDQKTPQEMIEGVWVIQDYTFDVLDDRAKGTRTNLEQRKSSQAEHFFRQGKGWVGDHQAPVVYAFSNGKVYLWNPADADGVATLTDAVLRNTRTQTFNYRFRDNKTMEFSMSNEFFNMEIVFVKIKD